MTQESNWRMTDQSNPTRTAGRSIATHLKWSTEKSDIQSTCLHHTKTGKWNVSIQTFIARKQAESTPSVTIGTRKGRGRVRPWTWCYKRSEKSESQRFPARYSCRNGPQQISGRKFSTSGERQSFRLEKSPNSGHIWQWTHPTGSHPSKEMLNSIS